LLYIKEAISNEKLGKSIKPEKKTANAPELNIELSENFDL
jgi:hypothetical protein